MLALGSRPVSTPQLLLDSLGRPQRKRGYRRRRIRRRAGGEYAASEYEEVRMVVCAAILVDGGLGITPHQSRPHDVAGAAVDHAVWSVRLHHAVGGPELIEDELVDRNNRLETTSNVFILVETVADQRSRN